MKKINITSIILLIYVIGLAIYGWVTTYPDIEYAQFFSMLVLSLVVVGILRFVQIKRWKMRNKIKEEREQGRK